MTAQSYADLTNTIGALVEGSDDKPRTAGQVARIGALSMMYLLGPRQAAERLYRLADEMSDAVPPAEAPNK